MSDSEVKQEVSRRVRHATGIKFMRDTHKELEKIERARQQKPRLILSLLAIVCAIAVTVFFVLGSRLF